MSDQKKVLIIEDEKPTSNVLALALKKTGLNVEATDRVDGLVQRCVKGEYDLIVLDLILPGQDGFDFLQELRSKEELKQTPVIVVTNLGSDKDREEIQSLGVQDYFVKAHSEIETIAKRISEKIQNGSKA